MDTAPIAGRIIVVRGLRVLLDRDLADLYRVRAIALRQQVKRNRARFPADFMFQLTRGEVASLLSQSVIGSLKRIGGSMPYVFTEQGVAMLSSVLSSDRAVAVNIAIMRAFVQVRSMLATSDELSERLLELERRVASSDASITTLFDAIRQLMATPQTGGRPIGFTADLDDAG
ncbi:MAG: ORF6N domain-containing protein [Gammaproteobacteria bacterium]|nr:ORF6N domain-containing protein [Gammaproteobacteria bacterium]